LVGSEDSGADFNGADATGGAEPSEFDEIKTSFTGFDFGNPRVGQTELLREGPLRESGGGANFAQHASEMIVLAGMR
jgi:hypothetical protein